jgi:predicted esterase
MSVKNALFFLHGSGGNGKELRSYLQQMPLRQFQLKSFGDVLKENNFDLFTPTAKVRRYTPMGGEKMSVWFDRSSNFVSEGLNSSEDTEGMDNSLQYIKSLVDEASSEQKYDNVFFGGFSMGGGLSLHAYRTQIHPNLRGVFVISSFAVNNSALFLQPLSSHHTVPLRMMHGEADDFIRPGWGRETAVKLLECDVDVVFSTYPRVGHDLAEEELSDLLIWIQDTLARSPSVSSSDHRRELRSVALDSKYNELESKARSGTKVAFDEDDTFISIPNCLSYRISSIAEQAEGKDGSTGVDDGFVVYYRVTQPELVAVLIARPVLACGSTFDVEAVPSANDLVQVKFTSNDPDKTAVEIGKRLANRLSSESGSLNPCTQS